MIVHFNFRTSEAPIQRLPTIPSLTSKLRLQCNGNSPIKGEGEIQPQKIAKSVSEVDVLTIDIDKEYDQVTMIATSSERSKSVAQDEVSIPRKSPPIEMSSASRELATLPSKPCWNPEKTVSSKIIAADGHAKSLKIVPSQTMTGCEESISRVDVQEAQDNVEMSEDAHSKKTNIVNSGEKVSCFQILEENVEISKIKEANEEPSREEESVEELKVDAKSTQVTTGNASAECTDDPIEEKTKNGIVKMPSEKPKTRTGKSKGGGAGASREKVGIGKNDEDGRISENNDDPEMSIEQEHSKSPGKSKRKSGKSKLILDAEISDLKRDVEVTKDDDEDDTPVIQRFENAKGNARADTSLIPENNEPDADCEINSNSSDPKLLTGQVETSEEVLLSPAKKQGRKRKITVSAQNSPNSAKKSDPLVIGSPKLEPQNIPKRL